MRRGMRSGSQPIPHPPPIRPSLTYRNRLRFTVGTALTQFIVTQTNILDTMLVATSAVAGFQLFKQFRIRAIEVWGPSPAAGTATTVSVSFPQAAPSAGVVGDSIVFSDTSVSVEPAHVRATPGKTLAGMWQTNTSASVCAITAPSGSVIDVELEFSSDFGTTTGGNANLTQALVGAATGNLYFRGLDGLALAGTNIPSVILGSAR